MRYNFYTTHHINSRLFSVGIAGIPPLFCNNTIHSTAFPKQHTFISSHSVLSTGLFIERILHTCLPQKESIRSYRLHWSGNALRFLSVFAAHKKRTPCSPNVMGSSFWSYSKRISFFCSLLIIFALLENNTFYPIPSWHLPALQQILFFTARFAFFHGMVCNSGRRGNKYTCYMVAIFLLLRSLRVLSAVRLSWYGSKCKNSTSKLTFGPVLL